MVIVAKATDVRLDLLTLLSEALVLMAGRCEGLLGVLQAPGGFWGTARPVRFGLVTGVLRTGLHVFELLPGFGDGCVCRPLFRGHGTGDGFDQLVLHVETHGLTPVALAKEVCIYLEGCMPSNSL